MSYVNIVIAIQLLSMGDLPDVGASSLWTDTPQNLHEVCMQPLTDFMICGFEMPLPLWTSWLCPHQIHNPARTGQAHHLDSAEEASANHRGWLWQTNKPTEMRTPWPHSRASVFCNLVTLAYFFSPPRFTTALFCGSRSLEKHEQRLKQSM